VSPPWQRRLLREGGGVSSTAAATPSRQRRRLLQGGGGSDWIGYGFERALVDLRMEAELGEEGDALVLYTM
jgi:hypothetical protein